MTIPAKPIEFWLLGWSKTHNGGAKVTFAVSDDDLAYFESATIRKGKVAGQRYVAQLVQLQDDETPDPQSLEPPPKASPSYPSGYCGEAIRLCKSEAFQTWVLEECAMPFDINTNLSLEGQCASIICQVCGVRSRKELNTNLDAQRKFIQLIRDPFRES